MFTSVFVAELKTFTLTFIFLDELHDLENIH